jgi:hypothetical protein
LNEGSKNLTKVAAIAAAAGLLGAHFQQQNPGPAEKIQQEFVKMAGHVIDHMYLPDGVLATNTEAAWKGSEPDAPCLSRIARPLSNLELVLANSCFLCANELAPVDLNGKCLRMVLALFLSSFWNLPALFNIDGGNRSAFAVPYHFNECGVMQEGELSMKVVDGDHSLFVDAANLATFSRRVQQPLQEQIAHKANPDTQRWAGKIVGAILQQLQYSKESVKLEILQQICVHARTMYWAIRLAPDLKCCVEQVFMQNGSVVLKDDKGLPGPSSEAKETATSKSLGRYQISWKPEAHSNEQVQLWLQTCFTSAAVSLDAVFQTLSNPNSEVATVVEVLSYFNFCRVGLPQLSNIYTRINAACSNPEDLSTFVGLLGHLPSAESIVFPPGLVSFEEKVGESGEGEAAVGDVGDINDGVGEADLLEADDEEDIDFIKSPVFAGAKRKYVFKTGDFGLGYYKDPLAMELRTPPSTAVVSQLVPSLPPAADLSYSVSPVDLLAATRVNTYFEVIQTALKDGPAVLEIMEQQSLFQQYHDAVGNKLVPLMFVGMRSTVEDFNVFSHQFILSLIVNGIEQQQYGIPSRRGKKGVAKEGDLSLRLTRQQMLPYILKEALRLFPGTTTTRQISVLYGSIFRSLPDDNKSQALALYAIQCLLKRIFELSDQGATTTCLDLCALYDVHLTHMLFSQWHVSAAMVSAYPEKINIAPCLFNS